MFKNYFTSFNFIDFERIDKEFVNKRINKDDVLVITWWDPKLEVFSEVNPKLLFWNVSPDALMSSNNVFKGFLLKRRTKKLIEIMMNLRGLLLMDDAPFKWFDEFKIKMDYEFLLPIPIDIGENLYLNRNYDSTKLRITYIGRAEMWKMIPLQKIIDDLLSIREPQKRIVINVVSDDSLIVKSRLEGMGLKNDNLCINYFENIPNYQMGEFLLNNSDLNIGMGTALLESAKIGIPSLLIDPSYSPILGNYRYRWLHEIANCNLGSLYDKDKQYKGYFLSDIIASYNNKAFLLKKSIECYEYVKKHHDVTTVVENFIKSVKLTELKFKDIYSNVFIYSRMYQLKKEFKKYLSVFN